MLLPEEYVDILAQLGLTHTEAKVYIALLCLKSATARNIHETVKIARQDAYRLLSNLEEKGLVEKVIAKPTRFRPIPAEDAISILFQKRKEQNRQQWKKAKQAFKNFKVDSIGTATLEKSANFILLSKSEANLMGHVDKPREAIDGAKKSVMGLMTFGLFMKVQLNDEHWKNAVRRGVKLQVMISGRSGEKARLALDPVLKNNDYFEIRWDSTPLQAAILLVDDKEAFFRTGVSSEDPVLWSADPSFVAMVKDYLKMKWKSLEKNG